MNYLGELIGDYMYPRKKLADSEVNDIHLHSDKVNIIDKDVTIYQELEVAYNKFQEKILENKPYKHELTDVVRNFASTYGVTLAKWEKTGNRLRKKGDNRIIDYYNKITKETYDNSYEYRFMYNFRHYTQHGGTPFNSIQKSRKNSSLLYLNKQYFIDEYSGMQADLKKDLRKNNREELQINSAIEKSYKDIVNINNLMATKVIELEGDKFGVLRSSIYIVNLRNNYCHNNGFLILMENGSEGEITSGKPIVFDSKRMRILPLSYAYFLVQSSLAISELEGNGYDSSITMPYVENGTIYKGKRRVNYEEIEWVRIVEGINVKNKKYYALYGSVLIEKMDREKIRRDSQNEMRSFLKGEK